MRFPSLLFRAASTQHTVWLFAIMSAMNQSNRDALLARMRATSREEVILAEMQRLGFWPVDKGTPKQEQASALIVREQQLLSELSSLRQRLSRAANPESALADMRKERMVAARARRQASQQAREHQRQERAKSWQQRRQHDILYLGADVSAGLSDQRSDESRLKTKKLPRLATAKDLATAMGISMPELRFLTFQRDVAKVSHYHRFALAKKTGGVRVISAPMPRLKKAQYWILQHILQVQPVHSAAHGFVAGRSIVSNAQPHAAKAVVVNLDLKDFFPSISYARVYGLFQSFGYSRQVATLCALLCCELPTDTVQLDGERFYVKTGERHLPQGAPSSPAITNLLCRRLDTRLQALAQRLGFVYTRYADDMTFSATQEHRQHLPRLLWQVRRVIAEEGFTLHPDKQHIMRQGSRQEVTGIVVNQWPTINRDSLRKFRAVLYQVQKDGPQGKHWQGNSDVINALSGFAHFVRMVDRKKGEVLCQQVADVRAQWQPATVKKPSTSTTSVLSTWYQRLFGGKAKP